MGTLRVANRDRFTVVNREAVNDPHLSFRAKGLLVWLLDKPDNWTVRSVQIAEVGPDGRDAVLTALKELEKAGYITREILRNPDGTFHPVCTVHESPGQTGDGKPVSGEPETGSARPLMKTVNEDCVRETSSLVQQSCTKPVVTDPDFDAFWASWPDSRDKKQALKAWATARKVATVEQIMDGLAPWLAYWRARNQPQFVPMASTWLNKERWLCGPPALPEAQNGMSRGSQSVAAVERFLAERGQ